jgi:hypothetical protein
MQKCPVRFENKSIFFLWKTLYIAYIYIEAVVVNLEVARLAPEGSFLKEGYSPTSSLVAKISTVARCEHFP